MSFNLLLGPAEIALNSRKIRENKLRNENDKTGTWKDKFRAMSDGELLKEFQMITFNAGCDWGAGKVPISELDKFEAVNAIFRERLAQKGFSL